MKTIILFVLMLCWGGAAFAQDEPKLTIGAKAGVNFYSLSSDELVEDDDTGVSYELGI
ncbi:hypothetical protein [Pontibacter litorisediminis]|uniref:hypothetical protein n=1 Tax=Pontibacter litorisediminis TaxID=1846260 RepID=UPI0023EBD5F3|nr:hypothetical protein [Pontibacter litorisediminis]